MPNFTVQFLPLIGRGSQYPGGTRWPIVCRNALQALGRVARGFCAVGVLVSAVSGATGTYLANLSARGIAGADSNVLTVGFVTSGGTKRILLRGVGPALVNFGVTGALTQPQLRLLDAANNLLASNSSWPSTLGPLFDQLGAFSLPAGSADAALVATLPPSSYTAQVQGPTGTTGIALAEIYDADAAIGSAHLLNLSARANSEAGTGVLTGGFVIGGVGIESVLLRGVGPTLASFGVTGALTQPVLTLLDSSGRPLATNAGWQGDSMLAALFTQVGAFSLPAGSADAAMVVNLSPGNYTVQVTGANGTTGVALVEIYEVSLPPATVKKFHPGHYMMLNIGSTQSQQRTLINQNLGDPNIKGFQICYTWAQLEPTAGNYSGIDSTIGNDLTFLAASGKQLIVQLQYKSKSLADFPSDMQALPGALVQGPDGYYVPNLWDSSVGVRSRFLALIQQIAAKYDLHPNLELVNLAESATVDAATTIGGTYTAAGWVDALQAVAQTGGAAFVNSTFEEYINHISGDDSLVGAAVSNAIAAGCAFGGPDIDPSRNNIPAYNYYAQYAGTAHLGSAVQPMDYGMTGAFWYDSDHSQTTEHLFQFATGPRLHVMYVYWLNNNNDANWQNAKATIDAHPWPWY